jgi:hypothetical protein
VSNMYPRDLSFAPIPKQFYKGGLLHKLSAAALRLYICLQFEMEYQEDTTVKLTNKYIAQQANIDDSLIKAAREDLIKHKLVDVQMVGRGLWHFRMLHPVTNDPLPLREDGTKASRRKDYQADKEASHLTPEQVQQVFDFFLPDEAMDDDKNGFRYLCPFHFSLTHTKRRRSWISVTPEGLWQCRNDECKHHGRRVVTLKTYTGGGKILDFIIATKLHKDGEKIARDYAQEVMEQILDGKASSELFYSKKAGLADVSDPRSGITIKTPFWKGDRELDQELDTWGDE